MMRPFWSPVWALNALQNSMMLTPCWPSAGPTGGAGLAWPPGIWSLIRVRIFLAMTSYARARLKAWHGLRAGADEPGHAGRVLDDRPGVVVEIHVDEHVAGQDPLLGLHLLAVLRLDHLLGRHDDAAEAHVLVHRVDAVLEVRLDLVLVP